MVHSWARHKVIMVTFRSGNCVPTNENELASYILLLFFIHLPIAAKISVACFVCAPKLKLL